MTHDELLKKLEGLWHDSYKAPGYAALRAVVELHKPIDVNLLSGDIEMTYCQECNGVDFPCPTIQAIEKELV